MNQNCIFMAHIMLELTNRLQERLAFDISYGSSHLDNCNLRIFCRRIAVKSALNLIGNMWDNLYSSSAKISSTLFLQDTPVNLTCGHIGILCQTLIDKSFIVAKIQIGLCAVVCYKHFSMLYRIHGSRVNINIRIKFLHRHCIPSCFQQTAK